MSLWVENVTVNGAILIDLLIKEKHNNIRRFCIYKESGSMPLASLLKEYAKLHQLLSCFTLDQIYNIDETMAPNQTLSSTPVRDDDNENDEFPLTSENHSRNGKGRGGRGRDGKGHS
ncbi:hypothetical protein RclHR1_34080001 [Rhizophagus clarus]|uniref:Uncharacterized protein n=1 Tax=Rhizophagus clarus TaxID=94130 RepID=A0A2Z6R9T6_9GLOM|nr:hypothetical protein RclHR1_34080001 [Rhizophagus clarus]GES96228.1 hypothetical protein RCL_jg557.t1 [Rhizophagus clarus]